MPELQFAMYRLLFRLESGIIAAKDFAIGQRHRELKGLAFGIPSVLEIEIDRVFRTDPVIAVVCFAWVRSIQVGPLSRVSK